MKLENVPGQELPRMKLENVPGQELPAKASNEVVCVTGANGFIASWIVKRLLLRGYYVRGTVRNTEDEKNDHLKTLEGAEDRLCLVKADILDYKSLLDAFEGCKGVFHTACPVTDDLSLVQQPAVKGTLNVLGACKERNVVRIILTSSVGAVYMDPARPLDQEVHEDCWSDITYLKDTKNGYCLAKTLAEMAAWEYVGANGLDMIVVNPSVVLGPLLQNTLNASNAHILKYLTGTTKHYTNHCQAYVDVRDVADAHILVYETPNASGRYLCAEAVLHRGDVVAIIAKLFPECPVPLKCSDNVRPRAKPWKISCRRLMDLGFAFTSLEDCIRDTAISLQEKGFL